MSRRSDVWGIATPAPGYTLKCCLLKVRISDRIRSIIYKMTKLVKFKPLSRYLLTCILKMNNRRHRLIWIICSTKLTRITIYRYSSALNYGKRHFLPVDFVLHREYNLGVSLDVHSNRVQVGIRMCEDSLDFELVFDFDIPLNHEFLPCRIW
jgi:hypothetical protein